MNVHQAFELAISQGVHLYVEQGKLKFKAAKGSMTDELRSALKENKTQLIELLSQQAAKANALSQSGDAIPALGLTHSVLSFSQQRLWFLEQLRGPSAEYNIPLVLDVQGRVDLAAVEVAFNDIMARHTILRSGYCDSEDGPEQTIRDDVALNIQQIDLSNSDDLAAEVAVHVERDTLKPFDLTKDVLFRVTYLCTHQHNDGTQQGVLLLNMHHIVSDGWSMEILTGEFVQAYQARVSGLVASWAPLPLQYIDYAHWQRETLTPQALAEQLSYWQQSLAGAPAVHGIMPDFERPATKQLHGDLVRSELGAAEAQALQNLARQHQLTPFMLIHSALAYVLSRHSNSNDIVIGTPIANRGHAELEGLIGYFANTLVLRVNTGQPSIGDYFAHVKSVHLGAQANQDVPFEQLVEKLNVPRSGAHAPLFQIMLTTNSDYGVRDQQLALDGLRISQRPASSVTTKFDLEIEVALNEQGVAIEITYDTALFRAQRVSAIANHLNTVLAQLAALTPAELLAKPNTLKLLSDTERQQQLLDWNDTALDYSRERCVHELFEQQAKATPDAIALRFDGHTMSYEALNTKANQLARYLRAEHNIGPDTLVGLCTERSFEMVIGIWGILKAGGAYVPLDPELPSGRLNYLIEDASANVVLSTQEVIEQVSLGDATVIALDGFDFAAYSGSNIAVSDIGLTANHLAYAIYTSGSTGKPKGVLLEHQALHNRIDWMDNEYGCEPQDKILQKTPYSFDVSVWEFVWPMLKGAELVIAKPSGHKDPAYLSELIEKTGVTKLHFVPSMLGVMLEHGDLARCGTIKQVFCSGEALQVSHVEQFKVRLPEAQLHNLYGPTEAAIDVSYWDCALPHGSSIPIGKPIQNIQLYILDDALNLLPQGACGELHIGGDGLARGYHNRPELTEERFIANPFYPQSASKRLYKTGDLVRFREDGNIEYMGRLDHQVKIRGQRIELGEIEYHIGEHAQVDSALVLAMKDDKGNQRLVAYVKPSAELIEDTQQALIASVQEQLGESLADYMIPANFVLLNEWPQTPNGKIDRKALPVPQSLGYEVAYVAPVTEQEKVLAELCAELLTLELAEVSMAANFFELGGHSLMVMELVSRLKKQGWSTSVQALFNARVLGEMAKTITDGKQQSAPELPQNGIPAQCTRITPDMITLASMTQSELDSLAQRIPGGAANIADIYPLAPLQESIFLVHSATEKTDPYVTTITLEFGCKDEIDQFVTRFNQIIARYDVLRTLVAWRERQAPLQLVLRHCELLPTWLSFSGQQDARQKLDAYVTQGIHRMDLELAPLVQLELAHDPVTDKYCGVLKEHHILLDHISVEMIMTELAMDEQAFRQLPEPLAYRQFIAHTLHNAEQLNTRDYFTEQLGDIDTPCHPFGLDSTQADELHCNDLHVELTLEQSQQIRTQMQQRGMSPAAFFHLAWAMVVSACSQSRDVVFGTVLSGRMSGQLGIEQMMGMMINTLPLRINLADKPAAALLELVDKSLLGLMPYEQASLTEAQACSGVSTQTPLFSAIFNYRHSRLAEASAQGGAQATAARERTNYPFNLCVDDWGEGFSFNLQVERSVDINAVGDYVTCAIDQLLSALNHESDTPVAQLAVLTETQQDALMQANVGEVLSIDSVSSIQARFERQVARVGERTALVYQQESLSYQELNARANALAHYLIDAHDICPDTLVGLCVGRGVNMIVGILAILKAGGAYVPLDPNYPQERLDFICQDAGVALVLSEDQVADGLAIQDTPVVDLNQLTLTSYSTDNVQLAAHTSDNLAYVIYTSGSTGKPKGVLQTHRNVGRLFDVTQPDFNFSEDDCWCVFHSFAFDFSVWEIWGALLFGGKLLMPSLDEVKDSQLFVKLCQRNALTILNQTPSAFKQLTEYLVTARQALPSLRSIVFGGEGLTPSHVTQWWTHFASQPAELINMYGITETTVHVTYKRIEPGAQINIGRPLRDQYIVLLDDALKLVPKGCAGEIYVGGSGLALGYLNREALSAERFIDNPFDRERYPWLGERLYRAGDLARYDEQGELHYLGRQDDQVKIRGHRIELGEVENRIAELALVDSALVLALPAVDGTLQLVAYVKRAQDSADEHWLSNLKEALGEQLPAYMLPGAIVTVQQWPLTPNGKVDRRALPAPDSGLAQQAYVAPRNDAEYTLVGIWAELLNLEHSQVSVEVNFFELGGHSLLLMRLLAGIREQLNCELSVKDIFAATTIAQQAQRVAQQADTEALPPIVAQPREANARLPLSFAQQRLWFIDKLNGSSAEYNMPVAFDVDGVLDLDAAEAALNRLIARHEALRTVYLEQDAEPVQLIRSKAQLTLTLHDLSDLNERTKADRLSQLLKEDALTPFKLNSDLMLRAQYILLNYADQGEAQRGVLAFNMHHIASDGWSVELMSNEFMALYEAATQGTVTALSPLAIQYADYALWQRDWLNQAQGGAKALETQLNYWRETLADAPAVHGLQLDKARPEEKAFNANGFTSLLPGSLSQGLKAFAEAARITPFMLVHSALAYILSRHSNQQDIVIGTPVANRAQPEVAGLIGYFANTLVLRVNTQHSSLGDYLAHVKDAHIGAQSHQDVPFEQLVDALQIPRSTAYSPVFQIMLTTNSEFALAEQPEQGLAGLTFTPRLPQACSTKFDIEINIDLDEAGLTVNWLYDCALFTEQHIAALDKHLQGVLRYLARLTQAQLANPLDTLPLLSEQERYEQLQRWNDTAREYDHTLCVHELFEQQVAKLPNQTALRFGAQSMSYRELNTRANQLADYLHNEHGVGPDTLVGLCVERSFEMVIGIWGILKAGGAYVPLDPELPSARLNYLVADASARVVLSTREVAARVMLGEACVIELDGFNYHAYSDANIAPNDIGLSARNLAYTIYTSGSTGMPKGVLLEHQALHNRIDWMNNEYHCGPDDKILQKTPYSFDVSVWEFVWPMLKGAELVIAKPGGHKDPDYLSDLIVETGITKLHFVPSMLGVMLEHGDLSRCTSIQQVFCSGEALQNSHVEQFQSVLPAAQLHNLYGPTEAAIDVSYWDCAQPHGSSVPIGQPIQNIQLYILDEALNLLPQGACGELHIGGDGLARGYHNRADLTEERFIANPFYDDSQAGSSQRLYKTGDLVRYRADGIIEYMGRIDHQVKIRGLRIELGEIEYHIGEHSEVDSALVMALDDQQGNQHLVAYVKPHSLDTDDTQQALIDSIKAKLSESLAEYMIPASFVLLEEWPQTPNGKIDRKALPAPEHAGLGGEYVAPDSDTERTLVTIWSQVLGLDEAHISTQASFFSLGGQSLLVVKLMKEIEAKFDCALTIKQLFKYTSVAEQALQLDELQAAQALKDKLEQSDNVERIVF
ncbi:MULTISPECIES: non-ribosomal peptide synthetase [unclassified Pseudoalteromonas]|uniref:non-ribosomal peptide synthetase n=1 Tax=unclassified Pseudoalteromonas TaxID=194690 RepID=UPI0020984BBD|nr:non-ribosomal peptide synthetase [Pseudoalteromonas sp. XMcav2-N]MCO7191378.1 amino acid adenylation domain-containing protein [Pseudoalteromonas sp. XMcav2-N]